MQRTTVICMGRGSGGDASEGIATVRAVWQKCFLLKCHSSEGGIPSSQQRRYAQICAGSAAANDAPLRQIQQHAGQVLSAYHSKHISKDSYRSRSSKVCYENTACFTASVLPLPVQARIVWLFQPAFLQKLQLPNPISKEKREKILHLSLQIMCRCSLMLMHTELLFHTPVRLFHACIRQNLQADLKIFKYEM